MQAFQRQSRHDQLAQNPAAGEREGQEQPEKHHCVQEAQPVPSVLPEQQQAGQQTHRSGGGIAADTSTEPLPNLDTLADGHNGTMPNGPSEDPLMAQQHPNSVGRAPQRLCSPCGAGTEVTAVARDIRHDDEGPVGEPQQASQAEGPLAGPRKAGQGSEGAGQVDEALPDVDVAEQRRIMRDIWLRQNISRGSPRAADKSSGASGKRRLKPEGEARARCQFRRQAAQDQCHV